MKSAPDFDRMYAEEGDPWQVGTSWYEQRKMDVVVASLCQRSYTRALDPACGTGHLARLIAARCDQVVARDGSASAIAVAADVCADAPNVDLATAVLPYGEHGQPGPFDLIVLSEFLYYLGDLERQEALDSVMVRAADRVEIVAVHWREKLDDGDASGDEVHAELREHLKERGLRHQVAHFDEEFVLDVFTRGYDHHPE